MGKRRKNKTRSASKRFLLSVCILVISALMISTDSPSNVATDPAELPGLQASYSAIGLFQVGVLSRDIMVKQPLNILVWYPAHSKTNDDAISYDYEIKMRKPFGRISIASYEGLAIADAPFDLSMAPYPLIILSPGFSIGVTTYGWLAEHLASYGFVVIAPDHTEALNSDDDLWQAAVERPDDILQVFNYVDEQTAVGGIFEGMIDSENIAIAGHSFGGYTSLAAAGARIDTHNIYKKCEGAIEGEEPGAWLCEKLLPHVVEMASLADLDSVPSGLWPAWMDTRVDAIVPMAGNGVFFGPEGLSEITVPVMPIGGTADADSPFLWGPLPTYEYAASTTKILVALDDAEHMIFTGPCENIPWHMKIISGEFCSDTSWDRTYAHELIKHFTTAFLLAELKHDADAAADLAKDEINFQGVNYQIERENHPHN